MKKTMTIGIENQALLLFSRDKKTFLHSCMKILCEALAINYSTSLSLSCLLKSK